MITVEDIEKVIHCIRYGGAGLDVQLLAVEYLSKARGWKKKAEFADLIMASFNEELPPEKAIEVFRCRATLDQGNSKHLLPGISFLGAVGHRE